MIINRVTITGADNDTDPQQLIEISKEYPFVEWGILFSKTRMNTPRYPLKHYGFLISALALANEDNVDINLSAHICGEWTREFFSGKFTFNDYFKPFSYDDIFERIQLNFNASNYKYDLDKVFELITSYDFTDFIFQHNKSNTKLCNEVISKSLSNVNFLYDSSGGRGTARKEWPHPIKGHYTGYAGGLNIFNLDEQLKLIESVTEENEEIWIDTETGVRTTSDKLDLDRVRTFLEIVKKYTK